MSENTPETVLQEAQRLVYGDRNADYGHPLDDFSRTAQIWSAILGSPVTAEQVGLCMIGVKLSRQCNHPKRDNMTDAAGYAGTVQMVIEERLKRVRNSSPEAIPQREESRLADECIRNSEYSGA